MFKSYLKGTFLTLITAFGVILNAWGQTSPTQDLRTRIAQDLQTNTARQLTAEKLRAVLLSSATAIDSVTGTVNKIFNTFSLGNSIGEYDASSGILKVTSTGETSVPGATPAFADGKYFDVVKAGTRSITGAPVAMIEGGKIIVRGTAWGYIPPSDLALSKALALEQKLTYKNLANPAQFTDGGFINPPSGAVSASASYGYTGFIPVEPGKTYSGRGFANAGNAFGMRHVAYYDAAKVTVPNSAIDPVTTITIPAGVYFVRANYYIADKATFLFELGGPSATAIPYGVAALTDTYVSPDLVKTTTTKDFVSSTEKTTWNAKLNASAVTIEQTIGKNKFNPTNIVANTLVNTGNYALQAIDPVTWAGWIRTGPVPCKPSTSYTISGLATTNSKAVRYEDAAGAFISGFTTTQNANTYFTFTTPANAARMYVNIQRQGETVTPANIQIEEGSTVTALAAYSETNRLASVAGATLPIKTINSQSGDANGNFTVDMASLGVTTALSAKMDKSAVSTVVLGASRNLANPDEFTDGFFIVGTTGTPSANASYGYTGYIKVTPGATYSGRGAGNLMRSYAFYTASKVYTSGGVDPIATITVPAGSEWVRVTYYLVDKANFWFEQAPAPTSYTKFDAGTTYASGISGAAVMTPTDVKDVVETLTLSNADKILVTGCSYEESMYSHSGKSWVNKLSNFSDWIIANSGVSGSRMIDVASRLRLNTPVFGLAPAIFKPTYVILGNNGNEYFPGTAEAASLDLHLEQYRIAAQAVEQMGAKPIISTDFHINGNRVLEGQLKRFADRNKYPYIGIGTIGEAMITFNTSNTNAHYPGFWAGSHPGVRTNSHYWIESLYGIDQLPRPGKSIKIFRPRQADQTAAQLNYNSRDQRFERWIEINAGERALNTADGSEAWYDRLNEGTTVNPGDENSIITNYTSQTNNNEYAVMMGGTAVNFTDWALFELIVNRVRLSSMTVKVKGDAGLSFYLKDNNDPAAYESVGRDKELVFEVSQAVYDAFADAVGTKFTSAGVKAGTVQFAYTGKLKSFAMGKGWFLCFTADADVLITDRVAATTTLTRVSGGTTVTTLRQKTAFRYGYTYFTGLNRPKGAWKALANEVSYSGGVYTITIPAETRYFEFDKLKLMANKTGAFGISGIEASYSGGVEKPEYTKEVARKPSGTELQTVRGFDSDWTTTGGWTANGNQLVSMPSDARDYPPYLAKINHVELGFDAAGFSQRISKQIVLPTSTDRRGFQKVVVRVVARMFPLIYNPTKTGAVYSSTPVITKTSNDLGMLCVGLRGMQAGNPTLVSSAPGTVMRQAVDTGWTELVFETELPPFDSRITLDLWRDCEVLNQNPGIPMQIFDVSFQLVP